jgi:hypothetical protein
MRGRINVTNPKMPGRSNSLEICTRALCVHLCMSVYIYVPIKHTHTHAHARTRTHKHAHTRTHTHTYNCTHIHNDIYLLTYILHTPHIIRIHHTHNTRNNTALPGPVAENTLLWQLPHQPRARHRPSLPRPPRAYPDCERA